MDLKKLSFVSLLVSVVLLFLGCSSEDKSAAIESSPVDTSVSRKLAVASTGFLSAEKENAGKQSHGSSVVEFAKSGAGVAYIEPFEGKYRVVHNGKPGKPYSGIGHLIISSDGRRIAYVASISKDVRKVVVDGKTRSDFGNNDNHWFTPDGRHYLSTVTEGDSRYIVIDGKVNREYKIEQGVVFSADSGAMAFSAKTPDGRMQFIISDMALNNKSVFDSCGDNVLQSEDASGIAVGCAEGGNSSVKVIDLPSRKVISESKYAGTLTHMRFSPYNNSFSYTYFKSYQQRYVVFDGKEDQIPAGDEFMSDPVVLSKPVAVAVVVGNASNMRLYRAFQKRSKNGKIYGYISSLISSGDGRNYAYVATNVNDSQMHIVVNGSEGPKFDRIVSPVFSPDCRYLVYRARQSGKRFLVVSDLKGKIISRHPDYDMVFQPKFMPDGASIGYGVLDGNELWWKVEKLQNPVARSN